MQHEGLMVVVSAPSGTGKGTLLGALKQKNNNIRMSVSATTRKPREGEIEGESYFFKSVGEFEQMIEQHDLLEWARYCDNYYGTPQNYVQELMKSGYDVLLELNIEGALNIKKQYPDSVLIFILPPSYSELRRRLEGRGTESPEVVKRRLNEAKNEMTFVDRFDYAVINDIVDIAAEQVNSILESEKLRTGRFKCLLSELVSE